MGELLYHDDFAGLTHEYAQVDDKTFVIKTHGDVEAVLDANKHDNNHAANWSPDRTLKHVARIPTEVYLHWLHKYGVDALNLDHADAVRKLLNDRDWLFLRTGGGTL
jgi:hypothetical protein